MLSYDVHILPAVFTPMFEDGAINYPKVRALYQHCLSGGYKGIFLNGTTGECMSLRLEERKGLLEAWIRCKKEQGDGDFKIFVHVGSSNLREAGEMAEHAQSQGADGIAMVPTFYFRPKRLTDLIDQWQYVALAAPEVAIYYYNITSLTGVTLQLTLLLVVARREIPKFAGLKNSFNDLIDYQQCLHLANGSVDLYWGTDEVFMMVYAAGNRKYVGSTYNFMGSIYRGMLEAYHASDQKKLVALQGEASAIYRILNDYNALVAGKEVMRYLGVDCGPVRKPLSQLSSSDSTAMLGRLKKTSFFDLISGEKHPVNITTETKR